MYLGQDPQESGEARDDWYGLSPMCHRGKREKW